MGLEHRGEADVVNRRRPNVAGERAQVVEGLLQLRPDQRQLAADVVGHGLLACQREAGAGGGDDLDDVVVEFATDEAQGLLVSLEEVAGELVEFVDARLRDGRYPEVRPALQHGGPCLVCFSGSGCHGLMRQAAPVDSSSGASMVMTWLRPFCLA